jgi:hypothetical protein
MGINILIVSCYIILAVIAVIYFEKIETKRRNGK